jgi:hypothetical protein
MCFAIVMGYAQVDHKSFTIKYTDAQITVDGALDEGIWEQAQSAHNFQQYFPADDILAIRPTEIKMLYNNDYLYIGIKAEHKGTAYVTHSLKRDYRAGGNDNISLLFDTFNDGTNAFLFGINPYGVRREALISNGGKDLRGFTTSWDVKWQGESKIYDDHYIAEMAIPMTSFKFKEGETKWRFNSYRFDIEANERSTWIAIPQNQLIFNLAFMGDMVFEKPLGKSRTPMALIPYTNFRAQRDSEKNESEVKMSVGGDAKFSIGNSMNLDLTVNPDFSNVEVDNLVTNLTRFEIALPERRQFFIDNNDLFGSFGGGRDANPFFSRRIGIAKDTSGTNIENKIIAGARLSGKLNEDWRLGVLSVQTEKDAANEIASNNNSMIALQRKVFARSNVSMFFINRQAFGDDDFLAEEDRYNRVFGIDYNLASADNSWNGKFYAHKSFEPGEDHDKDLSLGAFAIHEKRNYNLFLDAVYVGDDFRSDLGFIRRTDIVKFASGGAYRIWPKKGVINRHIFEMFGTTTYRPTLDYQNTDYSLLPAYIVEFKNQSEFEAQARHRYVYLSDGFDPTGTDGVPLPADSDYSFTTFALRYRSDRSRNFSFFVEPSYGSFFNGDKTSLEAVMTYRIQPKAQFSLAMIYDHIELPAPYATADIWLVSPRVELTFSKSIFWTTLVQYSNQQDNFGINSRLQWRFAPLSDIYLVYTDNYFVNVFEPRNRSINLKFTYWLNI